MNESVKTDPTDSASGEAAQATPIPTDDASRPDDPAGSSPWWRRRLVLLGAISLVLALVAGLTIWLAWPDDNPSRAPFDQAVTNLVTEPAIRYQNSSAEGRAQWDVVVTANDRATGTVTIAGQQIGLLRVDGKSYVKLPDTLFPGSSQPDTVSGLTGKWLTGDGGQQLTPQLPIFPSPIGLANELQNALAKTPSFLLQESSDVSIDGVAALRALTPAGQLYVSQNAPHRVLRLVPSEQSDLAVPEVPTPPSLPSLPDMPRPPNLPEPPELPELPKPSAPNLLGAAPLAQDDEDNSATESGQIDLPPMSEQDLLDALEELTSNVEQLTEAVDTSIQFNLQGSANVACSPGGCSVTANVTSSVTSNKKLTGGEVNATLTATVSINGRPGGSCTSAGKLPLNGAGQISCQNPGAGAVFAAVQAAEKARAEALSRARGGAPVPYTVATTGIANVNAVAHTQAEVEQMVRAIDAEKTPQVRRNQAVGDAASDAIAARYPGARREVTLQAPSGTRRLDVLTPQGLAIESKVGRTSLTSRTRQEIARDVELLNDPNSSVKSLLWEFSVSPTTGRSGPSGPLAKALDDAGIPWVVK